MPTADVDAAQSNVPVYQQSDVVEARMPDGTVRGEIFDVSEEAGMPVYSVQWESPVQGVMVGRYSGEELSALQPAAEPETGIELVMPTDEEVAAVTAERLRSEKEDENDCSQPKRMASSGGANTARTIRASLRCLASPPLLLDNDFFALRNLHRSIRIAGSDPPYHRA